jgi:probable HAF family extracellular repeat protein
MWFRSLLELLGPFSHLPVNGCQEKQPRRRRHTARKLSPEPLEERCLLSYSIVDVGTLGGNYSDARGINTAGDVVGSAYLADNYSHAYLYSGGSMSDLGTLGGFLDSYASGINDVGHVVGFAFDMDAHSHAFVYSDGTLMDLGTLGGIASQAFAINNVDQIVGQALTSDGTWHAFLYNNGVMNDLWPQASSSIAWGINDSGQVVGSGYNPGDRHTHAFVYSDGAITDLGTLTDDGDSSAYGINAYGQIVGSATVHGPSGPSHAFLYTDGAMIDLGTLGGAVSTAYGINSYGQVVGTSEARGGYHAFLYSDGTMTDLNDELPVGSGWTLAYAWAINDAGQIAGWGTIAGETHGYLLTPDSSSAPHPTGKPTTGFEVSLIQQHRLKISEQLPGLVPGATPWSSPTEARPAQQADDLQAMKRGYSFKFNSIMQSAHARRQARDMVFAAARPDSPANDLLGISWA